MKKTFFLIVITLIFFQCKNYDNTEQASNDQVTLGNSNYIADSISVSKTNTTKTKDTVIVKLENLNVIIEVDEDEKEDFIIKHNELTGINKTGNVYQRRDTIQINSEYSEMTGISNLINKKIIVEDKTDNLKQLKTKITYVIGVGYGFDALGDDIPAMINEYTFEIVDSVLLDLSINNEMILKSYEDIDPLAKGTYFNEVMDSIYFRKKKLYTSLINDTASNYYKDEYYRKSIEEFLIKKVSNFKSLEDLDASEQTAYIVIKFQGETKDGVEFIEYLGG